MKIVATIGLDIAKQVLPSTPSGQVGTAGARRKMKRSEVARHFSWQPACQVN